MPQPTRSDVHVDRTLTNISVAHIQDASNFIAQTVFPLVPVEHRSDKYFIWTSADFRRSTSKPRAPATESAGGGMALSTDNYSCEVYAQHKDIDDQTRANSDPALDLDAASSTWLTQQMMIQKEENWASDFFTTGVWTTDVVGGTDFTAWTDGSSDPEKDVADGMVTVMRTTGIMPNTLVVGLAVHMALKRHAIIVDKYKHTSKDSITPEILARYFEVDRYLVAKASKTTSQEGASSETNAFIMGNHALLTYVPPAPGLMVPASGYTFYWRGLIGSGAGYRIKRFRMEHLASDRVESEWAFDHKKVSAQLGYFFSGAA